MKVVKIDNEKIWLTSPHMSGKEQKYVQDAFDTNWVAPLGANVNGFEADLEQFIGEDKQAVALSSGTAALHLALVLLGIEKGDEVICQSLTFAASANPIVYQGATPVFVDSEPDTWNICPKALEAAIKDRILKGKKPKAIIAVHLYGMPYQADEIRAVADRYEIPIVEDAAEALGSSYNGKMCGTFGDLAVFSFNGSKIITTSSGGALVCPNVKAKEKAVFLATQAREKAEHYQHREIGYNYRLSNISAGIGRGQMEVLKERIGQRRAVNGFYTQIFAGSGVKLFKEPNQAYFSNHWLSVVLLKDQKQRETLRLALKAENIESRPAWKPMHLQPVFKDAPYYGKAVAETIFNRGLCLPSGSNLSKNDKKRIYSVIKGFLQNENADFKTKPSNKNRTIAV